jgi:hypothetical protein
MALLLRKEKRGENRRKRTQERERLENEERKGERPSKLLRT